MEKIIFNFREEQTVMTTPALPLKPGVQLASTVCTTRVVVVKALAGQQSVIECGGSPPALTVAR
jgi:hypothetical protein